MYVWGVCVCEGQTPWVHPLPGEEAEVWRQASLHSYKHLSPQLFSCERLHLEAATGLVLPEDFLSSLMTMCLFLGENLENTEEHKEEDGNHSSSQHQSQAVASSDFTAQLQLGRGGQEGKPM